MANNIKLESNSLFEELTDEQVATVAGGLVSVSVGDISTGDILSGNKILSNNTKDYNGTGIVGVA